MKICGIDHRFISPYNPRADGKVERSIGTIMSIIKKLLHGSDKDWPLFVPFAQLAFNNKISTLTNSPPFTLMFGRNMNEIRDYTNSDSPQTISLDEWKIFQEKIQSLIYPSIINEMHNKKSKMVQSMNKHRRQLLPGSFPDGAIVMLKDTQRANKFEPKYIGPYSIVRRTRNGNYLLRDSTSEILDRHIPPDQLKLISAKPRKCDLEENIYELQDIHNHRGSPGKYEYLVSWKGFRERTWEPAENFIDNWLIKQYWLKVKSK